jgi:hypothetical protein
MVHFVTPWESDKKQLSLPKEDFPSGTLNLLLFDAKQNPLSERLVFVNNEDQTQVTYEWRTDSSVFTARSLVNNRVILTDDDEQPLTGNFSVAVTADHTVVVDTTVNILTQLLLTSDLRGHIDNPAAYFKKDNVSSGAVLDLLMMTQGWRRYDVAALAQGSLSRPATGSRRDCEPTGTTSAIVVKGDLTHVEIQHVWLAGQGSQRVGLIRQFQVGDQ